MLNAREVANIVKWQLGSTEAALLYCQRIAQANGQDASTYHMAATILEGQADERNK